MRTEIIKSARRIVVKLGTALLSPAEAVLDTDRIETIAEQVAVLREDGRSVVLVSSGAVSAGLSRLGHQTHTRKLARLQSAAAVGQVDLMNAYRQAFDRKGIVIAQLLLTRDGLDNRARHLNARNTVDELLRAGVVPIINENDTVSVDELRFGDNDMLSAQTADLVDASMLLLLSTVPGLLDGGPDGRLIAEVEKVSEEITTLAWNETSEGGTGGMQSKLAAVRAASAVGIAVVLADGREKNVLPRIMSGEELGTFFHPTAERGTARKRWLLMHTVAGGTIVINAGAASAITGSGKSLLAIGIVDVKGQFDVGSTVDISTKDGAVLARGVANFSAEEIRRVKGQSSPFIQTILGRVTSDEIVHRDYMAIGTV